jgi:hypothetical protein
VIVVLAGAYKLNRIVNSDYIGQLRRRGVGEFPGRKKRRNKIHWDGGILGAEGPHAQRAPTLIKTVFFFCKKLQALKKSSRNRRKLTKDTVF